LQLSRGIGYSSIHYSLIGETLREFLLLLRTRSVLFKDNDHLAASAYIFGVDGTFTTHLDDFTDLIFGLASIFCKTICLVLHAFLRDGIFGLEDCGRSWVLHMSISLETLSKLLVGARTSVWSFLVTVG
jgi:hypothetical protein